MAPSVSPVTTSHLSPAGLAVAATADGAAESTVGFAGRSISYARMRAAVSASRTPADCQRVSCDSISFMAVAHHDRPGGAWEQESGETGTKGLETKGLRDCG